MSKCNFYNPDNVFKRFRVVEFPTTFIELSTDQILDVEVNISKAAYLKTMCEGRLMKFDDAREISASHRAFTITTKDDHTIQITFQPKNECISRAKRRLQLENRFVFDLRLMQVNEVRCCNDELHAEIGRYYISGQYEYCKISHSPKLINFGDVVTNSKVTKYVRIRNESHLIEAKICADRLPCFEVIPAKFTLPPNSSIRLSISVKPTGLKVARAFSFRIRNPHDKYDTKVGMPVEDKNYITYLITNKINISFNKIPKKIVVESLHKLYDQLPEYTYLNEEVKIRKERKVLAYTYLDAFKSPIPKKNVIDKNIVTGRDICISDVSLRGKKLDGNFCKSKLEKVSNYDLFNILFFPLSLDFGRIAVSSYGESNLTIKNKTKYDINIKLFNNDYIFYNKNRLSYIMIKLKSLDETKLVVFCRGFVTGIYKGTIDYMIDDTYSGKHPYSLDVGSPVLMIPEKCLKFGMVTSDCFTTTVSVRIFNYFNIPVNFKWVELNQEIPFEILPMSGCVPSHSCKICAVNYVSKQTKSKTHEIELISESTSIRTIPVELSVQTRKLSIKFLQPFVTFKDIPLNLITAEKVKLENSSREIVLFNVLEPLIPGVKIEPMGGIIRPKMIMTFDITVKISCVMEFVFDIFIRINNKENVTLPISGNVIEPKITIHPKNIYMSRVPCHMITYVPVTFQNLGPVKSEVEVLDADDDNIFDVYIANGNEKQRVFKFDVDVGQSKIVYVKVYDVFRREYEIFIPFKINGLLGPPNQDAWSTELSHYIKEYEQCYENNTKVKLKTVHKDISYCRISGVITVPWINISVEKFEIYYNAAEKNSIDFTMTNISKYSLYVTIVTSKLSPNFDLKMQETEEYETIITETSIKFDLDRKKEANFTISFHPKGHGKFISTALLFLDKLMTIPYYNLTFVGKRETPLMTPSTYRVIFPPCFVGVEITQVITVDLEVKSDIDGFTCATKEETKLSIKFLEFNVVEKDNEYHTIYTVELKICADSPYIGNCTIQFYHTCGSVCDVETHFCITYCILTLHANRFVYPEENPYPYYPLSTQSDFYNYLEKCTTFLEKWMFQQGFRRDLYPVIPDTFHAIASSLSSVQSTKTKGINVSYLNFVRRIAGPLMKHVRKISVHGVDDSFKYVKEIHDTYREIIHLLRSRGGNVWVLQAKFLLSYEQFVIYSDNVTPKCNADIVLTKKLLSDKNLFKRLNKQSWLDFILQSYKVFVMDSCFFECVCVTTKPRNVLNILMDWYNEQISIQHKTLRGKSKPLKQITNITTDLSDGIALASAIINFCPFLNEHFKFFCEIRDECLEGDIINNACLIIEAMNQLRLYFPLSSRDFLEPNFLQMLFLSIHLYVVLPMFKTKDILKFSPPFLRSSSRQVSISPTSQESLIYNFMILNNTHNNFYVEKSTSGDNGKKMFLTVRYTANFVNEDSCILLVHGYNKTRIFDTYIVFSLRGNTSSLSPFKKCKVTGTLYRPNKVDILVSSPFLLPATFQIYITDVEPTIPLNFEETHKPRFYVQRLNLFEQEITLTGSPKDSVQEPNDHKLYLQMICLNTQVGNSWIWFLSDIGQFFIRVTTQPRWDLAVDSIQAKVQSWPLDPCSCGESCECYRTTVVMIPHRNDLMLKALRYALLEHASASMMHIFDELIVSTTGKIILAMLLEEGGTIMTEVHHILRSAKTFRISSRALIPRLERVTQSQNSDAVIALPVTIPANDTVEKYNITFTSECGMDIRTYRIFFIPDDGPME